MIVTLGEVTRRAFVAQSTILLSSLVVAPRKRSSSRAPFTLRIGVVASMSHDQQLGWQLGLHEARHAATLFGGSIVDVPLDTPQETDGALTAIVGGGDESSALVWTRHAAQSRTIYMNVGCASDRLRGPECSRSAFHIAPSDAMARDAVAAAGQGVPARADAWHPSLSRFGADTLNQRFLTRFHEPMRSAAWGTWFAVKVLWESALRQRSADPARLAEYLLADTTQFDGHKGSPLSFRPWDHQLRQPLYVVSSAAGTATGPKEIPEITGDVPVRDALDQLGGSTHASTCGSGHE